MQNAVLTPFINCAKQLCLPNVGAPYVVLCTVVYAITNCMMNASCFNVATQHTNMEIWMCLRDSVMEC